MARSKPSAAERTVPLPFVMGGASGAPDKDSNPTIPLAQPEPVRKAPEAEAPAEPVPPVKRYQVLQDRRILHGGSMTVLKAGKVIDEQNYRIDSLTAQGVQLRELEG